MTRDEAINAVRIKIIDIEAPGQGYQAHVFADGLYMTSVRGHSVDADGMSLCRHWSLVDQAHILFRGYPLDTLNPNGHITPAQFGVTYDDHFAPQKRPSLIRKKITV
jgi:hypothetical protein